MTKRQRKTRGSRVRKSVLDRAEAEMAGLFGGPELDPPKDTSLDIQIADVFRPLLAPARYKGAHGGRGSGKSHFFATMAVALCVQRPATRIVCAREVQKSLRDSVKLLLEDKIRRFRLDDDFRIMHDHIKTPGSGLIIFQGLQDHTAESIRSLEGFHVAYLEEAHTVTERSFELLRPTIREPGSQIWASWNPRRADDPLDKFLRGEDRPDSAIVVEANWRDNPWFPDVLEIDRAYDEMHNPLRYEHIWEGAYEPSVVGALWTRQNISQHRVSRPPPLVRILVGVDPPISSEEKSNEAGIVAVGLGDDGHGYVLADESLVASPEVWGRRSVALHDVLEADAIVPEVNQGGEMVTSTIRAVRPGVKVRPVHSRRGKSLRAEPISALYDLGRMHHVGSHPRLESQMCLMTPDGYQGDGSPDRVDALVHAATALFGPMTRSPRGQGGRPTRTNMHPGPQVGAR